MPFTTETTETLFADPVFCNDSTGSVPASVDGSLNSGVVVCVIGKFVSNSSVTFAVVVGAVVDDVVKVVVDVVDDVAIDVVVNVVNDDVVGFGCCSDTTIKIVTTNYRS